ncbi:hypothetical protein DERF_001458 [Dermatophagoides farinae]|uniref:Uncharacterized protein n=1 Tax=Dermatophagoides farinae TaxID=6954 RepID=A0A922IAX7_DERFA|nr:hypothetical protein DERF_001458 [Dermatophagoides farinae]
MISETPAPEITYTRILLAFGFFDAYFFYLNPDEPNFFLSFIHPFKINTGPLRRGEKKKERNKMTLGTKVIKLSQMCTTATINVE